jgi:hypothetical protein
MLPRPTRLLTLGVLTAALFVLPVPAEEGTEEKATEAEATEAEATREEAREAASGVITNETLERLFGPAPEAPPTPVKEEAAPPAPAAESGEAAPEGGTTPAERPPTDPLELMRERQAQAAEKRRLIAEAEQKVTAAKQRVADLEKRRLAIVNPFMARPEIPADEKEQWDSEGSQERLATTDGQLEEARQQLADAEGELGRLRSGA